MRYTLNNAFHHLPEPPSPARAPLGGVDVFSSGLYFDGWRDQHLVTRRPDGSPPRVPPRTWLLERGWRRLGRIRFYEIGSVSASEPW
ncbi:MAG: hypothetical protein U0166_10560 [Acidobacteriota bacterium]